MIFAIEAGVADPACRVDIHGRCGSSPWDRDLIVELRHVTAFRAHKAQSRLCTGRGVVEDPTSEPFRHSAVTAHRRGKDLYLAHTVPLKSGDMTHETNLSSKNSATGGRLLVASSPAGGDDRLGLIEYNGDLSVHNALLNVVQHDNPHLRTQAEKKE